MPRSNGECQVFTDAAGEPAKAKPTRETNGAADALMLVGLAQPNHVRAAARIVFRFDQPKIPKFPQLGMRQVQVSAAAAIKAFELLGGEVGGQ